MTKEKTVVDAVNDQNPITEKHDAAVTQINNKLESVYYFTKNSIITMNKSSNLKIGIITLTFKTAHFDMICEELLIKKRIL